MNHLLEELGLESHFGFHSGPVLDQCRTTDIEQTTLYPQVGRVPFGPLLALDLGQSLLAFH